MERKREREPEVVLDSSSSSSSAAPDGEEETETLIIQNEAKRTPPTSLDHRSTFEIGDLRARDLRGFLSGSRKYFLLAVCLSAILVVVYFSFDLRQIFQQSSPVSPADAFNERMREAELLSLYLLRNQQTALLRLWNRTFVYHSGSKGVASPPMRHVPGSNSSVLANSTVGVGEQKCNLSTSSLQMAEFRWALLEQIKLNKEIREALLSAHRPANGSSMGSDGNVGPSLSDLGAEVCSKRVRTTGRRSIEWKPMKSRYLFAICVSGRMSNHLICLEKHMVFAALLNRVLVLPSPNFDYQYDRVIDIDHINDCLGRKVVISFEEFANLKKNKIHIDRFICYMANPPCFLDEEHLQRLRGLGLSMAKLEAAWPEDAKSKDQKKRIADDITSKFSCEDEVLAIGDTFYADVEADWEQPGGPLSHKCKTVIQPSRLITLTAERFVQTFLGENFIALHFRRYGFLKFCNAKEESCFFPIPQAAKCILRVVEKTNAPIIYLSTDAEESETNLLQRLVMLNDKPVPLVRRPSHTHMEKWDALLYRNHLGDDNQVEAMLDKTICAISKVFIGSSGSTFTEDILRLRNDWGSASLCDEYLCHGERPNFIASQE